MGIYTRAGQTVYEQVSELIDGYHPELAECQLKVQILFAHPSKGKLDKPPLTVGGFPVPGVIKKTGEEDLAGGAVDVKITLDAQAWESFSEQNQCSLLDRLLTRLEVQRDKDGAIKTYDCGRPMLKLRKYDYFICGYESVIRRYGREAVDAKDIEDLSLHYNTLLPIASPQELAVQA